MSLAGWPLYLVSLMVFPAPYLTAAGTLTRERLDAITTGLWN